MSYNKYYEEEYSNLVEELDEEIAELQKDKKLSTKYINEFKERRLEKIKEKSHNRSMKRIQRDMEQGFQGWEYKFNTVASSRGDYPSTLNRRQYIVMCS